MFIVLRSENKEGRKGSDDTIHCKQWANHLQDW